MEFDIAAMNSTDPIFPALERMRDAQDRVFESDDRLPDREVMLDRLKATETVTLMTTPTTREGALELLRFIVVEIGCEKFDRELCAEAIERCVAVLESGTVCNS